MDFYAASNWASGWHQGTILMNKHTDLSHESLSGNSDCVADPTISETFKSEKYDALQQQHETLKGQHELLKKHFSSLSETVRVLGDQSSQTTKVAQQAQDLKLDIISQYTKLQEKLEQENDSRSELNKRHLNLQAQLKQAQDSNLGLMKQNSSLTAQLRGLRDAVDAMSLKCNAAEDKLLLQSQLHSDKLRLLEVSHNTLKDRCKTIAVSAEQHRVANVHLEERHKSMTKDMTLLADGHMEIIRKKDMEIKQLQSLVSSNGTDSGHLQSLLCSKENDVGKLKTLLCSKEHDVSRLQELVCSNENDVSKLQSLLCSKEKDVSRLQSLLSSKENDVSKLQLLLCSKENDVSKLQSQVKSMEIIASQLKSLVHTKEKDVVHLQSQVNSKDANIINLQSEISTKDGDIKQLKRSLQAESTAVKGMEMRYTSLQDKERELSSLKTALEANKEETRRLQGRVDISTSLLKSHPIDPCLNNKTKKILRSSAEILELAHDSGSVESMRRCLGQVGEILVDLHEQLDSQHRLSSAWLDQVRGI